MKPIFDGVFMKKYEEFGDVVVEYRNVRFVVKKHYHPPYLWVEKWRTRSGIYDIAVVLDVSVELAEALEELAREVRLALEEQK